MANIREGTAIKGNSTTSKNPPKRKFKGRKVRRKSSGEGTAQRQKKVSRKPDERHDKELTDRREGEREGGDVVGQRRKATIHVFLCSEKSNYWPGCRFKKTFGWAMAWPKGEKLSKSDKGFEGFRKSWKQIPCALQWGLMDMLWMECHQPECLRKNICKMTMMCPVNKCTLKNLFIPVKWLGGILMSRLVYFEIPR